MGIRLGHTVAAVPQERDNSTWLAWRQVEATQGVFISMVQTGSKLSFLEFKYLGKIAL